MVDDTESAEIEWDEAAHMELDPDTLHESKSGDYLDCPECGSPATIENIVQHGRCNAYLDEQVEGVDFDVSEISCTAVLQLELAYTSDPESER